jgi:hypothetical protein
VNVCCQCQTADADLLEFTIGVNVKPRLQGPEFRQIKFYAHRSCAPSTFEPPDPNLAMELFYNVQKQVLYWRSSKQPAPELWRSTDPWKTLLKLLESFRPEMTP